MPEIGVRELKSRASEIVRAVRDERTRYIITYRGQPVGILSPLDVPQTNRALPTAENVWGELVRLGEEIARAWRSPLTGVQLLSAMRDE